MGNSSNKARELDGSFHNLSGHGRLSEREASSAWYRYGVAVTDVYDVVEVLGQGHMGEVFTVRRKTTGHHTNETREKIRESSDDLRKMLREEEEAKERARLESMAKKTSIIRKPSGGSSSKDASRGASPGRLQRKSSIRRAAHKVNKVIKKNVGKDKSSKRIDPDANSDLSPFIKSDEDEYDSHHQPRVNSHHISTPIKSIMKGGDESKYGSADGLSGLSNSDKLAHSISDIAGINANNDDEALRSSQRSASGSSFHRKSTLGSPDDIGKNFKGVHFQRTFAVKTILTSRVNKDQLDELVNEIMIMRKLDHPYVLKLYEVYHVKRKLWLVTELLQGGDLSSRKLNEHDTKNVIEQVLRALVYLHRMGIVHRDIKLENILYENHSKQATVRLIDFGLSRTFDRTAAMGDYMRTPYTMSPETAASKGKSEEMTDKTDVWAVGVITFIMLSGEFPFIKTHDDLNDPQKMEKLKKANLSFGITWKGRSITGSAKEFVRGCLQGDPDKRWTAKQALENLQTIWAPEVDKIWEDWLAEVKKNKKPEFIQPQDLPGDNDTDDGESSETGSHGSQSSASWFVENDDEELPPPSFDNEARAKMIKSHVQKTVRKKKAEGPIDTLEEDLNINLNEVERYTKFGFMKKTILITMANTMDRGDVPKLRELFLKADTEDTGTITLKELLNAFREISPEVDEKRVEELFSGIDRDKSGHIHYAEFLAALAESHGLVTLDRLTEAFDRIDTDGKGYITHEDLKSILGKDYDKVKVDKMIEEGDFKKNNKIDYEELLQLMFSDPVEGDALAGNVLPGVSPGVSFGDEGS